MKKILQDAGYIIFAVIVVLTAIIGASLTMLYTAIFIGPLAGLMYFYFKLGNKNVNYSKP